jgi:hypothetical protein
MPTKTDALYGKHQHTWLCHEGCKRKKQHEATEAARIAVPDRTMPSAFNDDAPQQSATAPQSTLLFASPSRSAAYVSGIGSAMVGVIRAFSPPCTLPSKLIGVSSFDLSLSLVDSLISLTTSKSEASNGIDDDGDGGESKNVEKTATIL